MKNVALLTQDLGGGDIAYMIISESDYKTLVDYHPIKKSGVNLPNYPKEVFDTTAYMNFFNNFVCDCEIGEHRPEIVLKQWSTSNFCPENVDLSEYNIVGMLALP